MDGAVLESCTVDEIRDYVQEGVAGARQFAERMGILPHTIATVNPPRAVRQRPARLVVRPSGSRGFRFRRTG